MVNNPAIGGSGNERRPSAGRFAFRGVELQTDGARLHSPPQEAVGQNLQEAIRANRDALIRLLHVTAGLGAVPCRRCAGSLDGKGRCWRCCDRSCCDCGRPTGTALSHNASLAAAASTATEGNRCEREAPPRKDSPHRPTEVDGGPALWDNPHTMSEANRRAPISEVLRKVIAQAVAERQTNYKSLERETGMTWASIMRFVRGSQSLRLDMADQARRLLRAGAAAETKG